MDSATLVALRQALIRNLTSMATGQSVSPDPFTPMLAKVMAQDEAALTGQEPDG